MISTTHDLIRILTIDPDEARGGTIRYITPYRVWPFSIPHGGGPIRVHTPVRTPHLPLFFDMVGSAILSQNQAELRLCMMELWSPPCV